MSEARPFHRLFGLSWIDFFQGTTVTVETEKDLSLRRQLVDLVILHKGPRPIPRRLPDGFEDLAMHNLVTFKSFQEALDAWALLELEQFTVAWTTNGRPALAGRRISTCKKVGVLGVLGVLAVALQAAEGQALPAVSPVRDPRANRANRPLRLKTNGSSDKPQ